MIGIPPKASPKKRGAGYSKALRQLRRGESALLTTTLPVANAIASRILGSGSFACRTMNTGVRVWKTL